MKSDKDVTKMKRVTFFLRHSLVPYVANESEAHDG